MLDHESKEESPDELTAEEKIDETLAESFPASDPPPWTLGIEDDRPDESADIES